MGREPDVLTYITEGKLKIMDAYAKSEENAHFYPILLCV